MRINKLLKIVILFVFTINCCIVMPQDKFVTYQEFELAYRNESDLRILSEDFDLLFILLLDSTHKMQFLEYDPVLEELFKEYSYGITLNNSTLGFKTQATDLKKIFDSDFLIKKFFYVIFDTTELQKTKPVINYPVYIKNNSAVVEIKTNISSDIFYLKLNKGVVQINWLGGVIE